MFLPLGQQDVDLAAERAALVGNQLLQCADPGPRSSDTAAARSACRRLVWVSCSATVASCAATAATCSMSRPVVTRNSRIRRAVTNASASSWPIAGAVGSRGAPSLGGGVAERGWPPVMT
jgi:hypothetical protein